MAIVLKPGDYQWRETPGGTGWSLLRHDPAGDTQTRLLRYSPTTVVPPALLDHSVQWLVTRGEARCGDLDLQRASYCAWPVGNDRPAVHPGPEGFTVLSIVYGPSSSARVLPRSILDHDSLPWQTGPEAGGSADSATPITLEMRSLSWDEATGEGARIWQLQPGEPLALGAAPRLQEWYVLRGSLNWEGERVPVASYLSFAPGDHRGSVEAEAGAALLFVNTHPAR
jgi:hypothetical protein